MRYYQILCQFISHMPDFQLQKLNQEGLLNLFKNSPPNYAISIELTNITGIWNPPKVCVKWKHIFVKNVQHTTLEVITSQIITKLKYCKRNTIVANPKEFWQNFVYAGYVPQNDHGVIMYHLIIFSIVPTEDDSEVVNLPEEVVNCWGRKCRIFDREESKLCTACFGEPHATDWPKVLKIQDLETLKKMVPYISCIYYYPNYYHFGEKDLVPALVSQNLELEKMISELTLKKQMLTQKINQCFGSLQSN
jgi:hypothetical protein